MELFFEGLCIFEVLFKLCQVGNINFEVTRVEGGLLIVGGKDFSRCIAFLVEFDIGDFDLLHYKFSDEQTVDTGIGGDFIDRELIVIRVLGVGDLNS